MTTDRRFIRPGIQRVTTDGKGRWYEWDGNKYWSVTSMLDVLNKHGLNQWRVNQTADAGVKRHAAVGQMIAEGLHDEAYEMLRGVADEIRDERADMGSAFHDYAEAYALGEQRPQPIGELAQLVDVFEDFVESMRPTFVMVEAPVFRRYDLPYAGTLDAIFEVPWSVLDDEFLAVVYGADTLEVAAARARDAEFGEVDTVSLVVDYTTAKYVYPEKGLQVTAYRHADFVGMPDGSTPEMPVTDGGAVLQVREDGWQLYPVNTGPMSTQAFRDVASLWSWRKHDSKDTIGKPAKREKGAA